MSEQVTDDTVIGKVGEEVICVDFLNEPYRQRLLDYDKVVSEMNALREALRIKGDSVRTVQDNYAKLRLDIDTLSRKYRDAMELCELAQPVLRKCALQSEHLESYALQKLIWDARYEALKKDV